MLEKVLLDKYSKIEKESNRKKASVSYIINLIDKEPEKFKEALNINNKEISQEELPEYIYNSVEKLIKELDSETTRAFGVTLSYFVSEEKPKDSIINLGWADYICSVSKDYMDKHKGNKFPHVLLPTETGLKVLNGYRDSIGLISIEEHRERNKKILDDLINSPI